jgi:TolB protein
LTSPTVSPVAQVQRLTDLVGLEEAPALSPDGRIIAFVAMSGGKRHIWTRLLAGGTPLVVTKDDADHYAPRWSPDSSSIIYYTTARDSGDPGTLFEIPALGGPPRRLVTSLTPGDLSRDGRSIAFLRFREGVIELAVATRDLTSTRAVARLPAGSYSNLRWSPDDSRVALLQTPGGADFSTNLVVIDVATGSTRVLMGDIVLQGLA